MEHADCISEYNAEPIFDSNSSSFLYWTILARFSSETLGISVSSLPSTYDNGKDGQMRSQSWHFTSSLHLIIDRWDFDVVSIHWDLSPMICMLCKHWFVRTTFRLHLGIHIHTHIKPHNYWVKDCRFCHNRGNTKIRRVDWRGKVQYFVTQRRPDDIQEWFHRHQEFPQRDVWRYPRH